MAIWQRKMEKTKIAFEIEIYENDLFILFCCLFFLLIKRRFRLIGISIRRIDMYHIFIQIEEQVKFGSQFWMWFFFEWFLMCCCCCSIFAKIVFRVERYWERILLRTYSSSRSHFRTEFTTGVFDRTSLRVERNTHIHTHTTLNQLFAPLWWYVCVCVWKCLRCIRTALRYEWTVKRNQKTTTNETKFYFGRKRDNKCRHIVRFHVCVQPESAVFFETIECSLLVISKQASRQRTIAHTYTLMDTGRIRTHAMITCISEWTLFHLSCRSLWPRTFIRSIRIGNVFVVALSVCSVEEIV